ncbi:hypothetical protein, partial [Corynebacterium glutamicum]|uniref:hypothetical protein n=1 Tax=Corynebacterium glutamicum TaxID=1718 RepID=UPI000ACDACCB
LSVPDCWDVRCLPNGGQVHIRAENARLRRELAEVKMDNEFLSKATAFFAVKQRDRKNLS